MAKVTEKQYLTLLHSCADNCSAPYCFFKMFLEHQHPDLRVICQIKAIEMLKWERSEAAGHDIGLQETALLWCSEGWAKAFAQVYEEGIPIREIYKRVKVAMVLINSSVLSASNVSSVSSVNSVSDANVSSKTSTISTTEIK